MRTNTEPVLSAAGITATITAVINMLVVLDVLVLDPDQIAAVNIAVGSVVAMGLAVWARGRVSPL